MGLLPKWWCIQTRHLGNSGVWLIPRWCKEFIRGTQIVPTHAPATCSLISFYVISKLYLYFLLRSIYHSSTLGSLTPWYTLWCTLSQGCLLLPQLSISKCPQQRLCLPLATCHLYPNLYLCHFYFHYISLSSLLPPLIVRNKHFHFLVLYKLSCLISFKYESNPVDFHVLERRFEWQINTMAKLWYSEKREVDSLCPCRKHAQHLPNVLKVWEENLVGWRSDVKRKWFGSKVTLK